MTPSINAIGRLEVSWIQHKNAERVALLYHNLSNCFDSKLHWKRHFFYRNSSNAILFLNIIKSSLFNSRIVHSLLPRDNVFNLLAYAEHYISLALKEGAYKKIHDIRII